MSEDGLKRDLGPWAAASIVVGTMIGSGIFLVPHQMILHVGAPGVVFLAWVFGGMLSLFGALTYAELSSAMPEAGGEYVYLREAYGPLWGFLYGWTQLAVAKSGSIASIATGFFLYLAGFLPALERPVWTASSGFAIRYGQLGAIALIVGLATVNYLGVRFGGGVQVAVTAAKLGLIAAIIAIGLGAGGGDAANLAGRTAATGGMSGFFAAVVAALWAYDGWNNVSMVSSEVRNPKRNLPLALIAGVAAVMGIYLLVNLAYFYVLSPAEAAANNRVAAEMMRRVFGGWGAAAVSVAAMISIFAALNGSILAGARVPYAMGRDGLFFRAVGRVHPAYRTPGVSIVLMNAWASLLVLSGSFELLYTCVIFASLILYGMTGAAVIVLRRKRPEMARPYSVVGYPWVPVLFVLGCAATITSTLRQSPWESVGGLALIALGLPLYFHWRRRFPG
jgi:APA family basic amino acid/polyamine antiporter